MDRYKLEYEMKKQGMTQEMLCKEIGISRSSLSRKLSGASEFTQSEIQKIMEVLHLNTPIGIFFKEHVS